SGRSAPPPGAGRRPSLLGRDLERLREEAPVVGREAAARRQLELPAMQRAREDAVLDDAETRQVGLQVRAAPLHSVARALEELPLRQLLGIAALRVLDPLGGKALEEAVQVLVVGAVPLRL